MNKIYKSKTGKVCNTRSELDGNFVRILKESDGVNYPPGIYDCLIKIEYPEFNGMVFLRMDESIIKFDDEEINHD